MPNDDLVVAKPENADSASGILADLLDGGFAALLDDKDIKHACLKELADAGCRPPANHVVWFCVRKLASAAEGFASETLQSKLIDILEANPKIAGVLRRVCNLKSAEKDKNSLKQRLLEELNVPAADEETVQADMTTELEVVTALHNRSALHGLSGQIADLAKDIGATLETVLRDMTEPRLLTAGVDGNWERSGRIHSVLERLTYTSGLYGFHGREDELAVLGSFLSQIDSSPAMNRFSWLLLTGPGGEGKSRLALEFCKNHVPAPWNAGKLGFEELKALTGGPFNWRPRRPTLFVIDYPAQAPEAVNKLLRMLDRDWKDFDLPVRVLLLERDIKGEWFKQFLGGDSASQGLLDHVFGNMRDGFPVPPLAPGAIITLMQERFEKAGLEPPPPQTLLSVAQQIDSRRHKIDNGSIALPRALFASAVAETMIEAQRQGETELDAVVAAIDRNDIFNNLIERDRQTRWRPACGQDSAKLECHQNLLAFATMTLGLQQAILQRPEAKALKGHIVPQIPDAGLLEAMGCNDPTSRVAAVEPDLLGEHFALSRLEALQKAGLAQQLIDATFVLGREDFARFCLRCLNDFPQRTNDVGLLFPSDSIGLEGARLFASLFIDLSASLGERSAWAELDQLMARLRLYQNRFAYDSVLSLRQAIGEYNLITVASKSGDWARAEPAVRRLDALRLAFPHHPEIAVCEARAAVNITNQAGKAGDWQRVASMITLLDAVRGGFPDHEEIAIQDAMAAVNIIGHAASAVDADRVEAMLKRLEALRAAFPDVTEIALEEAKAALNISIQAGAAGDWAYVEGALKRLDNLRAEFPGYAEIGIREASAAVNLTTHASGAGDGPRVDEMFDRLDALRTVFPDHSAIAQNEAMAIVNTIGNAGAADDWGRVEALYRRVRKLLESFGSNRRIVSICGYAVARRYYSYRRAGQFPDLENSVEAAMGAMALIIWSLDTDSMTGAAICLIVIKDVHGRFSDNEDIGEICHQLEETGLDWGEISEIDLS